MHVRCTLLPLTLLLLCAGVGCSTEKKTFDVSVENHLDKPITFWLVKEHGPMEDGWLSPEDIGMLANPPEDDALPDVVVPPGKTATTPRPLTGTFEKGRGRALLRVFAGTPTLPQMLAMDHGSADRLDLLLKPGRNRVVIKDKYGLIDGTVSNPDAEH